MVTWNNLDTLASYQELKDTAKVNLAEVMTGENGAERVKNYSIPMAAGFTYNYAAKAVDDNVLAALVKLADEAQLADKFKELYNGAVINTGENRLVLHHMTRGQLGDAVTADGVDKRAFYVEQQNRIADFANKVHAGEIMNAAGEKFTTVVQIGIGGSDLGPRAMYLALENWAKKNNTFKMEAKFISNVDPDDAAAVLNSIDVAHSIFVLVSKSGTTLETLTNESFVKDALKNAGLNPSNHMIAVTSETSPLAKSDDYLAAFFMDDYIGGRFSSTSAVGGAVLSLAFGPEVFAQFLDGAAEEDKLSLLTVQKITDDRWQIIHFYAEKIQKNNEDINFYQEILYRFYKEQERENIKYLVINFAEQKQQILHYSFPRMPLSEIKKALYWELQEDIKLEEYYYTYTLKDEKENYNLKVNLINKNLVDLWQQLAKEQNLNLYSVFCQNDVKIDAIAEDEYIKRYRIEKQSDIFNCELQIDRELLAEIEDFGVISKILVCFSQRQYQEFLPKRQQLSYLNWQNIYLLLITILLSCSCCLGGYAITKYYQAERQEQNIKEEIALVQNDIDDIEQLKQQEALIKDKQKLVQNLEEKSVNIYAILINLGVNTVDDVALTDLKIKDGEIFLKGRARNYQNIAVYKEKLSEIRFFQTSEIGEIKINTEDNLLDFTMKIVMR